jgi:hypothetical protein
MLQIDTASREAHRARVLRGSSAVLAFLRGQFPRSKVEISSLHGTDIKNGGNIFTIHNGSQRMLVRVTDEVLDLDNEGVMRLLRQFAVGRTIRNATIGEVVVVKMKGVAVESV